MVYIFTVSSDTSTRDVIDWLRLFQKSYLRFNSDLDPNPVREFHEHIDAYWYRKGIISIEELTQHKGINSYLLENRDKLFEYYEYRYTRKKHINTLYGAKLNKLIVLDLAASLGLQVPESHLLASPDDNRLQKDTINKTVNDGSAIRLNEKLVLTTLTQEYTGETQHAYSTTLFQEKIDKKYELRIFYLNGRFWSMAIFSQNDQQTSLDFRNYNSEKPNRTVPYKLPHPIETKLDALMKKLDLNSGSIDMIVSKDNKYYFLEINPVGQFGMVSHPCNYHLEKAIATYLAYD